MKPEPLNMSYIVFWDYDTYKDSPNIYNPGTIKLRAYPKQHVEAAVEWLKNKLTTNYIDYTLTEEKIYEILEEAFPDLYNEI